MKFLGILVLVSVFLGISAFSFFGMDHQNGLLHCLAQTVYGGVSCPENWVSELDFHFSALHFFSLAIINLISFAGVGWLLLLFTRSGLGLAPIDFFGDVRNSLSYTVSRASFIDWLSLHENSPTLA